MGNSFLLDELLYMIRPFNGGEMVIEIPTNRLPSRNDVARLRAACDCFLKTFQTDQSVDDENQRQIEWLEKHWEAKRASEPKQPKRFDFGYVYLAVNARNGFSKIGFSQDPEYREQTLQSEEPEVAIVAARKGSLADERALHGRFASCRIRGEWFNLTDKQKQEVIDYFGDP